MLLCATLRGGMPTQRKSCLDNPNLPPKALRDILAKRRKRQKEKIKNGLTPVLTNAFAEYRNSGQKMSMQTVDARLSEIADALEAALDGQYDGTAACAYCAFEEEEKERARLADEQGTVSSALARPMIGTHDARAFAASACAPGKRTRAVSVGRTQALDGAAPPCCVRHRWGGCVRLWELTVGSARSQAYEKRTPSCAHHILCLETSRLHIGRRDARGTMRCELERVGRLANELLEKQSGQGTRGVVVIAEEGALAFEKEVEQAELCAAIVLPTCCHRRPRR